METTALTNTGDQVSTITEGFCWKQELKVESLGYLLCLEGTNGIKVSYKEYLKMNFRILKLKHQDEDVLMLLIENNQCEELVLVDIGATIIDKLIQTRIEQE